MYIRDAEPDFYGVRKSSYIGSNKTRKSISDILLVDGGVNIINTNETLHLISESYLEEEFLFLRQSLQSGNVGDILDIIIKINTIFSYPDPEGEEFTIFKNILDEFFQSGGDDIFLSSRELQLNSILNFFFYRNGDIDKCISLYKKSNTPVQSMLLLYEKILKSTSYSSYLSILSELKSDILRNLSKVNFLHVMQNKTIYTKLQYLTTMYSSVVSDVIEFEKQKEQRIIELPKSNKRRKAKESYHNVVDDVVENIDTSIFSEHNIRKILGLKSGCVFLANVFNFILKNDFHDFKKGYDVKVKRFLYPASKSHYNYAFFLILKKQLNYYIESRSNYSKEESDFLNDSLKWTDFYINKMRIVFGDKLLNNLSNKLLIYAGGFFQHLELIENNNPGAMLRD